MRRTRVIDEDFTPSKEGAIPEMDPLTHKFRRELNKCLASPASEKIRLAKLALDFARETEERILELNQRVSALEALSQTDELTGLLNRRGFRQVLERNLRASARYGETGLLAYIDLDGFKSINDEYGHAAGDEILCAVSKLLQKNVRSTDYAARLGGDEFAILFVRADLLPARERAREIAKAVNKITMKRPEGKISVRASLGVATYDGETECAALLERADRAMYLNKKSATRRNWHLPLNG
ncbi:MAG: GGDEF domain-containing protein [Parvibaculum sp.]